MYNYTVLYGSNNKLKIIAISELERKVAEYSEKGYEPIGGVSIMVDGYGCTVAQAMILKEDN